MRSRLAILRRYYEIIGQRKELWKKVGVFPPSWPKPSIKVLFYPEFPPLESISFKLCAINGYEMTSTPDKPFDVAFKRVDATYSEPALLNPIRAKCHTQGAGYVVNEESHNISKDYLNKVFERVFGYSIAVDPRTYQGMAVLKSNRNALHDGRVVGCPIRRDEIPSDVVCQKLVDNEEPGGRVVDHRVPVYGGRIPLVYLKYRPIKERFANRNAEVCIVEPDSVFSMEEQNRILAFAQEMGIDYGEFDVLRDKSDGLIYVVDANNTPWGPPNGLSRPDYCTSLLRLAEAFESMLQDHKG